MTTQEVFKAALALPEEDRARLRDELTASLHGDDELELDDEFIAKINERCAAADRGAPGVPADEAMARLRRR